MYITIFYNYKNEAFHAGAARRAFCNANPYSFHQCYGTDIVALSEEAFSKVTCSYCRNICSEFLKKEFCIKNDVLEKYTGNADNVIISEKITEIGKEAFKGSSLISVQIPDTLKKIGFGAFHGCHKLTSVKIPDGVTIIGDCAFWECFSLTSVEIPDSVKEIGLGAFNGCTGLKEITLPEGISLGGSAFPEETKIIYRERAEKIMSNFDIANGILKKYRGNESSVIIPNGVTTIDVSAFENCKSITEVCFPAEVTTIKAMAFQGCTELNSVKIPAGVTSINSRTFYSCNNLSSVLIPDSVTKIRPLAFFCCTSLTTVEIPDSVKEIGMGAFRGCIKLKEVSLPEKIVLDDDVFPKETKIIYRKKGEKSMNQAEITNNNEAKTASENAWITDENFCMKDTVLKTYLGDDKEVKIPDGVTVINDSAFARCTLVMAEIPDSVTEIRDYAFASCTNLKEIILPQNVHLGEGVFCSCQELSTVKIRFPGGIIGTFGKEALSAMFEQI